MREREREIRTERERERGRDLVASLLHHDSLTAAGWNLDRRCALTMWLGHDYLFPG